MQSVAPTDTTTSPTQPTNRLAAALAEGLGEAIAYRMAEQFQERSIANIADAIGEILPSITDPEDFATETALSDAISDLDLHEDPDYSWCIALDDCFQEIDQLRMWAPDRLQKVKAGQLLSFHWREAYRQTEQGKKVHRAARRMERRIDQRNERDMRGMVVSV